MSKLTVVVHIRARPDRMGMVEAELRKLLPLTREEDGCLQYDLHQDRADPAHFLVYETWESHDHLTKHRSSPHIEAYRRVTEGAVVEFTLYEMNRIG